jgi:hypothetical protein
MAKPEGKEEGDWFAQLDEELEKKTSQITDNFVEQTTQKDSINKALLGDFFRIWIRFNKINVHLAMSPDPQASTFATFAVYPEQWSFRPDYDFAGLDNVSLMDRTQGRVGDSIKVWYYNVDSQTHLRAVFEFCEGEHYYKYAGWKRIFSQYVLLDVPIGKFEERKYHDVLADVIKLWYESHLKRDREIILKHIREKYEKGETFTQ